EQARISKRLVTLDHQVPVVHHVGSFAVDQPRAAELIGFLKAMEFSSITKTIAAALDADMATIDAVTVPVEFWPPEGVAIEVAPPKSLMPDMYAANREVKPVEGEGDLATALRSIPVIHATYETVTSMEALDRWVAAARAQGHVSVDTETDSLDAMQAN